MTSFFRQESKIDIKDILDTKKPLLMFNTRDNRYFNPKNDNDDTKDNKKIEELKKDFSMPFPYNNLHKENRLDALWLYDDLKSKINSSLENPILYTEPTTLCKGYSEDIYKSYIKTSYYNSTEPDIILAITKEENNINTSNIFGFAYIDIRKQFIVKGKVLVITAICSAELETKYGKSVKGIGSLLIDSIEKIGKVFDCHSILVNHSASTEGFFKKMGFEKLNKKFMILNLYNHDIVHTIVGDSTINSETPGGRKGTGSRKGGKSHKKSRKHTRKSR